MKAKNGYIWDLARRISHQSWLTNWRYRELSEAYRDHVVVGLKGGKGKTTGRFANEFTELVYSALQSFMIDACILRDNLAEFYWWHLRQGGYVKSSKTVTTMGGLLNGQFKAAKVPDRVHSFILDGTTENTGWIWLLTEYRNLVVHVAPLTLADQVLFASWVETDVNGRSVVGVKLPLPKNPLALSKSRNDGSLFEDPAGTRATFANVMKDDANTLDCLQYATTVVSGLALLSWHTIFVSPIKPKMPEFHIVEGKIVEKD